MAEPTPRGETMVLKFMVPWDGAHKFVNKFVYGTDWQGAFAAAGEIMKENQGWQLVQVSKGGYH